MFQELKADGNPLANASWDNIVKHFRHDEIIEKAVDDSIQKKKGGSKIKGSGGADRKPSKKSDPLPAGNLSAAGETLMNRMERRMAEDDEG